MDKQLPLGLNLLNVPVQKKEFRRYSREELLQMRDKAIRKDFHIHTSEKHLDSEYVIYEILQHKYFLNVHLIFQIVRGTYERNYHK